MSTSTLDRPAARDLPRRPGARSATSAGPTSAAPTSAARTSTGPTSAARTSTGPTSAARTSTGPTSVGRTSAGTMPATPARWDRVRFAGEHDDEPATPATVLPDADPALWAGALVRAAVETLQGVRPPTQLSRVMTAQLYDALVRRADLADRVLGRPRRAQPARVRRVRVCEVVPGTVEAAVVVHDGTRVRAAAVRLRVHRGRWRATALEIG